MLLSLIKEEDNNLLFIMLRHLQCQLNIFLLTRELCKIDRSDLHLEAAINLLICTISLNLS